MIDVWHPSKTAILKLCAHAVRGWTRALTFNIIYDTPHKLSFRMSGRSALYDSWFSLRHKFYISLSISICISIMDNLGVAKIFRFTCTLFWSISTYSRTLSRSFSEK